MNTTCWFSCIPWDFINSHNRRGGFSSYVCTNPNRHAVPLLWNRLAYDDLEMRLLVLPLPNVAAINTDDDGGRGLGKRSQSRGQP